MSWGRSWEANSGPGVVTGRSLMFAGDGGLVRVDVV